MIDVIMDILAVFFSMLFGAWLMFRLTADLPRDFKVTTITKEYVKSNRGYYLDVPLDSVKIGDVFRLTKVNKTN